MIVSGLLIRFVRENFGLVRISRLSGQSQTPTGTSKGDMAGFIVFIIFGFVLGVVAIYGCGCLVRCLWEVTFRRDRSEYAMGAMPAGVGVVAVGGGGGGGGVC